MKTQSPRICGSCRSFKPDKEKTLVRGCYLRLGYCAKLGARVERCDFCLLDVPVPNPAPASEKSRPYHVSCWKKNDPDKS